MPRPCSSVIAKPAEARAVRTPAGEAAQRLDQQGDLAGDAAGADLLKEGVVLAVARLQLLTDGVAVLRPEARRSPARAGSSGSR